MNYKQTWIYIVIMLLIFQSIIIGACIKSDQTDEEYVEHTYDVLIASSLIDVKTTRIPFVIIGSRGEYLRPDSIQAKVRPKSLTADKLVAEENQTPNYYSIIVTEDHIHKDGEIHVHENDLGIHVLNVDELNYPGEWELQLVVTNLEGRGGTRELQTIFTVSEEIQFLPVGSRVPLMTNRTLESGFKLKDLTTHPDPNPIMYSTTVEKAIERNRPSVVVFSTPAYCQSKVCGPVLDIVMSTMDLYESKIDFIHIEPFDLETLSNSGTFLLSQPAKEWGLPSEPWIIIVDRYGKVTGKFEGIIGRTELIEVFDSTLESN